MIICIKLTKITTYSAIFSNPIAVQIQKKISFVSLLCTIETILKSLGTFNSL